MRAILTFGVLGPLEVRRGDVIVPLSAGKHRVVLAALLLRGNRTVPIQELIDKLWDCSAPMTARATVQKYVMRLRRGLDECGFHDGGIRTEPEGYRLEMPAGRLDLDLFDTLVRNASRAATVGDATSESDCLREALGLWRGVPPLQNVPSESVRQQEVPQLVERYLQTLERRIEVDLLSDRHAELVGELIGLVRRYPLRERFWAQRMRALHGAGRQGDALEAYREVTRLLSDQLGVDPGVELQAVHRDLLHSCHLPTAPVTSTSVAPADRPGPSVDPWQPVRQLPMASTSFVGRGAEITRITTVLDSTTRRAAPPVVVITGPPGVGKTTLAVHIAHLVAERFSDGQLFVDMCGHASGDPLGVSEVLGRFLGTLTSSPPPLGLDDRILAYRSLLAGRRLLVVLDNVNSVAQVRALLPGSAGCAVLVTSRNELAGLAVSPGAERVSLRTLSPQEGFQLLDQFLGGDRVAADVGATAELVSMCAGLTLALRVAATHLVVRPQLRISDYVVRLRSQDRISALSLEGDDRASLTAAFEWSYRQLSTANQRLLRLVGLVPGRSFTAPTVAALAETSEDEAAAGLEELAAASLLEREAGPRYQLNELTQTYAVQRCRIEDLESDREHARRRLFDYYIGAVDAVVPAFVAVSRLGRPLPPELSAGRDTTLAVLDGDRAAMVAAVCDASEHGPLESAYHLADALRGYFTLRGHTGDWLTVVEAGLVAARRADSDEAVAAMLNSRGALAYYAGDTQRARDDFEVALEIYRRLGSAASNAVRISLGTIAQVSGDVRTAVAYLETAIAAYERLGEANLAQRARENLVLALLQFGDLEQAQRESDLLADTATRPGNHVALGAVAMLTQRTGDLRQAAQLLGDAAAAAAAHGDQRGEVALLGELAMCYLELGWDDAAFRLAESKLAEQDDLRNAPTAALAGAGALRRLGRVDEARSRYRHALQVARKAQNRAQECEALIGQAELELATGRPGEAANLSTEATATARDAMLRLQLTQALLVLAGCHRRGERFDQARGAAGEALDIARRCAYPLGEASSLSELAEIEFASGDLSAAQRDWRQAERLYTGIGSRHAAEIVRRLAAVSTGN